MRVLASFRDRVAVPWANGGGETTELVSRTESTALTPDLRPWRLSIARLDRTGPFSSLPGILRTFLPTAEVALDIDGRTIRVGPAQPVRFLGSADVRLTELAEPCFAINLMIDENPGSGGRGELTMSLSDDDCTLGRRFVLSLQETSAHPRFELLALDAGDSFTDGQAVVLSDK